MAKFNVGDTVTLITESDTLYIVTSCHGYKKARNGETIDVFDYELIQILPVSLSNDGDKYHIREESVLVLYARYETKMWHMMVDFIRRDRKKNNHFEEPAFLTLVQSARNGTVATKQGRIAYKEENIRYVYDTIDDCLEALSDLNLLIEMFSDDTVDNSSLKEYIKEKKKVIKQLKNLTA